MNANWRDLLQIIASIVAIICAILAAIKWTISRIITNNLKDLEGKWHEYHWTNPGGANADFKWLDSTLEAKTKFFSSYKLVYVNAGFPYHGTARYIDKRSKESFGDILLKVQKVQHEKKFPTFKETIYFRYNIPKRQFGVNNDENDKVAGIWLSYNFDRDITSGASILSRKELSERELEAKFDEYFENKTKSIVVRNNGTIETKKSFWKKLIGK